MVSNTGMLAATGLRPCGKRARKYAVMPRVQAARRTFETDVADEARQRHGRPSAPFAVARRCGPQPDSTWRRRASAMLCASERISLARDATNAFGPFGRFRDAVIAFARHVVVIRHMLAVESFRHGRFVEADAVCMQKVQVTAFFWISSHAIAATSAASVPGVMGQPRRCP